MCRFATAAGTFHFSVTHFSLPPHIFGVRSRVHPLPAPSFGARVGAAALAAAFHTWGAGKGWRASQKKKITLNPRVQSIPQGSNRRPADRSRGDEIRGFMVGKPRKRDDRPRQAKNHNATGIQARADRRRQPNISDETPLGAGTNAILKTKLCPP